MNYYFEAAIVLMLCMLRSSLLHSAENYYNLKESELRELERVEESFLRQLFDQQKGCPIMYNTALSGIWNLSRQV